MHFGTPKYPKRSSRTAPGQSGKSKKTVTMRHSRGPRTHSKSRLQRQINRVIVQPTFSGTSKAYAVHKLLAKTRVSLRKPDNGPNNKPNSRPNCKSCSRLMFCIQHKLLLSLLKYLILSIYRMSRYILLPTLKIIHLFRINRLTCSLHSS